MHQNVQICTLKFKISQIPMLERGYGAPSQTPPPPHYGASLGAFGPSVVPVSAPPPMFVSR